MAVRLASGLPERIVQVLRDFLPAELDLIDADQGGDATPDILDSSYHSWERRLITKFPAVTVNVIGARALEHYPKTFGSELRALYDVDVSVHVAVTTTGDALRLQELCFRYSAGIYRVLCDQKVQLETALDPTLYAHDVAWRGLRFGPEADQEAGTVTRSAVVAIEVLKVEAR